MAILLTPKSNPAGLHVIKVYCAHCKKEQYIREPETMAKWDGWKCTSCGKAN